MAGNGTVGPQSGFDVRGAVAEGYTPSEIADFLQAQPSPGFDIAGARAEGYTDHEIVRHLGGTAPNTYDIHGAIAAGLGHKAIVDDYATNPLAPYDAVAARKAGVSDADIVAELSRATPKTVLGALIGNRAADAVHDMALAVTPGSVQRGVAHTVEGIANTADMVGATNVGGYLHRQVNRQQFDAPTSAGKLTEAYSQGHYGDMLANLPGAVGESIPQLVGAVGAAAGGTAIGGPVGGAVGLGGNVLLGVATQAGDIAKARAKADGRMEPNDEDIAWAVGSSGIMGALDRIGLGKAAGGALANATKTLLGRTAPAGRIATGVGSIVAHGLEDAAGSVVQQVGETADTAKGLTIDPNAIVAQGVIGAGTRTALAGARRVGDVVTGEAGARAREAGAEASRATYEAMSPEDQRTVQNQAAALKVLQDQQAAPTDNAVKPSATVAARTAADGYARDVGRTLDALGRADIISPEQRATVSGLVADARNSQRSIDTGEVARVLGDLPLPADTRAGLADAISQIDQLSTAGVATRGNSVLSTLGGSLGASLGAVAGKFTGVPWLTVQAGGQAGAAFGQRVGSALGLGSPALVKEGTRAIQMLDASGVTVPETRKGVLDAVAQSRDVLQAQAAALGLNPENYGFSTAERRAMTRDAVDAEKRRQQDIAAGYKAHEAATADAAKVDAERSKAYDQADAAKARDLDAAFRDMEARQRIEGQGAKAERLATAARTRSEVAGFLADQAAIAKDQQAHAAQNEKLTADGERQAARGEAAMGQLRATTDGAGLRVDAALEKLGGAGAGMPLEGSGRVAETRVAPSATPIAGYTVEGVRASPGAVPEGARAIGPGGALEPSRQPVSNDLTRLMPEVSQDGAALARKLPDWQFRLGKDIQEALQLSGRPVDVNYARESLKALRQVQAAGHIDHALHDAIAGHDGRLVQGFYNLVRQAAFLAHDIDRRTIEAQAPSAP